MPRIRKQLSNDSSLYGGDLKPIKTKSVPRWHFCYVCREWYFMPQEDFASCGHFDLDHVKTMAAKSVHHKHVFQACLKSPDKPQPKIKGEYGGSTHHRNRGKVSTI